MDKRPVNIVLKVKQDTLNWQDGHNVVLHKFAHQLDQEDDKVKLKVYRFYNTIMSRRDDLHFPLRRTLEKDGWIITSDPLILVLGQTLLKADLGAEKLFIAEKEGRKIAVEIKDFDASSVISELEKTMGQLQLYQWALEEQEPERQLFLAISQAVYIKHFQKPIFQIAIQRSKINLLIYAPDQEVIIQWITH
ncbi:zinc-dependent peptidase [Anabaena cylindrica UHCC 0172]|uniref:XisH family protein n=1 Tax=Anabaena cylindrica TaxID=1165 RepID=UPI002B1EBE1D|nr:zinc-dependent peptidase [Anabaena cylindrica]MEA5554332.1 zinc-dependent peptidase [Anabaena cylindrica UHCC 0172]